MPRMHITLAHIQEGLNTLSLDELYLLCNFIRSQLGEGAKHQQPALQKSSNIGNLARLLEKVPSLSDPDKRALLKVVTLLCEALEPQKGRRGGTGSIEIKWIRRAGREYGPFAYLRYWVTGGDWNRNKRTMKSVYLGKEIALALNNQPSEVVKQIKKRVMRAISSDTLDQLNAELSAESNLQMKEIR
jgi:hypothetical protein